MPVKHFFGPTLTSDDFPKGPQTVDDKIRVFEDQVRGWKLNIAEEAIARNGDAGFAVMDIVTSYFELIGTCIKGPGQKKTVPDKKKGGTKQVDFGSGDYFRAGMMEVFDELAKADPALVDRLLRAFYKDVRCGLYHQAMTRNGVLLSGNVTGPVVFQDDKAAGTTTAILINPKRFVARLQAHLKDYVALISDTSNTDARNRFEAAFDQR